MNGVNTLDETRVWRWLWIYTLTSIGVYGAITALGSRYALGVPNVQRPILVVIGLFVATFVIHLLALRAAVRLPNTAKLLGWIVGTSVLFRAILIVSPPFMEIDIYRYLWDGAVSATGESPFRYSPLQVSIAVSQLEAQQPIHDERLHRLAELAATDDGLRDVLGIIHYAELRTVYPPVSQWVFRAVAHCTPGQSSADTRVRMMKIGMVLFDVATLGFVLALLQWAGRHWGWAIAYGWCPLVLKEFANSGHLDAIAVCLCTASLAVAARWWQSGHSTWLASLSSTTLLALAVGAKLYPIVLGPLLLVMWWRRASLMHVGVNALVLATVVFATFRPMYAFDPPAAPQSTSLANADDLPPPPMEPDDGADQAELLQGPSPKNDGLLVFLQKWEMNDWLFCVVLENLRPQAVVPFEQRPWFSVVPDDWSSGIVSRWATMVDDIATWLGMEQLGSLADNPSRASFLLTRCVLTGVLVLFAFWLAWTSTSLEASVADWLAAGFLTLAWFWLLAPTQNPWYWCWAMPLLPFVRGKAWMAISCLVLAYYTRFWLTAHFTVPGVFYTRYDGQYFFYFVVVWLEFAPCLVWLLAAWWLRNRGGRAGAELSSPS